MRDDPGGSAVNWFDSGGRQYAQARPDYPGALVRRLAGQVPGTSRVLDVGCGSGQFTAQLAEVFARVVGVDPSRSQLAGASRGRFVCGAAERLPVADAGADLVTVAQAAHWFDLPAFFAEASRVLVPGGLLALITYATPVIGAGDDPAAVRFDGFYRGADGIGPYWPAQRRHIDDGYASIAVPGEFTELPVHTSEIRRRWTCDELLAYVSTWSAVRAAREAGRGDLFDAFAAELPGLWGRGRHVPARRPVRWAVTARMFSAP